MSEWITDRLPTEKDAYRDLVWVTICGEVVGTDYLNVSENQPWMPITPPEPYVKPKTWVAERYSNEPYWRIRDTRTGELCNLVTKKEETMRKLEAFLNEVMP